jgi:carbonic anhydrase
VTNLLSFAALTLSLFQSGQGSNSVEQSINRDDAYRDPKIAFQKLNIGNRRFIGGKSIHPRQGPEIVKSVAKGQEPFAIVMGCSDSRVPNEIIFDQGVGDLFVIRTAGQVPAESSFGTIEFGVAVLKSKLIVVLGHTECGAVKAAISLPENPPGSISYLINSIRTAVESVESQPGDKVLNATRANVVEQVNSIRRRQPVMAKAIKTGEIIVVGAIYDLETGKVNYIPETLKGTPVDPAKFDVGAPLLPPLGESLSARVDSKKVSCGDCGHRH